MSVSRELLQRLADGRFHSGQALADALGCSRSAVWKRLQALQERTGLAVEAVSGRGYRLARPLELLQREAILAALPPRAPACTLHLHETVDSTNRLAREALEQGSDIPAAWLAEYQQAGRGRRGRQWHSPYGRNIVLSLAWRFDLPLQHLPGLSIAVGAALAESLASLGLRGHGLKWPNDLYWQGAKLGGLLIEIVGESDGPVGAVIGVGLNLDLGSELPEWIDQPVTDLQRAGLEVGRNRLAGRLLGALLEACRLFEAQGLPAFMARWRHFDLCAGREVQVLTAGERIRGRALGIGDSGGLRLLTEAGERLFHGGEVSLRLEGGT